MNPLDQQHPQTVFCSDLARGDDEPLLGTATQARVWLLLEVREPWQSKIMADNNLPPEAQAFLRAWETSVPGARVLFIKKEKAYGNTLRCFLAIAGPAEPQLYEFHLHDYSELADLNLSGLQTGAAAAVPYRRTEPLFLVCSNGKRDKCCAKYGLAAYRALSAVEPEATWQSSHIGGHRYAPNVLLLPHSINYGHLTPAEVVDAAAAYRAGRLLDLEHYRGRTAYDEPVQAAAIYLRQALELLETDALALDEAEELGGGRWRAIFTLSSGAQHAVTLHAGLSAEPTLVSCSPPATKPVPHYELVEITLVHSPV